MLGIGAALVAALLIGLWAMLDVTTTSAETHATPGKPGSAEAAPARSAATVQPAPAAPVLPHATGVAPRPEMPAADDGHPAKPPNDPTVEKIDAERRWMNAEILSTEQAVLDCVGKGKLDGYVTVPFKIVKKGDKVVVDAQPPDIMTFSDPTIGECMRTATAGMAFDSLPAGAETVSAYRKIIFKQGALVEDWLGPHEITTSPAAAGSTAHP